MSCMHNYFLFSKKKKLEIFYEFLFNSIQFDSIQVLQRKMHFSKFFLFLFVFCATKLFQKLFKKSHKMTKNDKKLNKNRFH